MPRQKRFGCIETLLRAIDIFYIRARRPRLLWPIFRKPDLTKIYGLKTNTDGARPAPKG
jgi:hypothetical protein